MLFVVRGKNIRYNAQLVVVVAVVVVVDVVVVAAVGVSLRSINLVVCLWLSSHTRVRGYLGMRVVCAYHVRETTAENNNVSPPFVVPVLLYDIITTYAVFERCIPTGSGRLA